MKVTFTQNRTVNDGTGTSFKAGQTYDLPNDSAARWIKRGAARAGGMFADDGAVDPSKIKILEEWADLPWPDLRDLAKQFDDGVRSKDDAVTAIEKELERRRSA